MTTLEGIPKTAWDYKLGNRSALEWVLDQYKEKSPVIKRFGKSLIRIASPITRNM